jgi:hypothetical protein
LKRKFCNYKICKRRHPVYVIIIILKKNDDAARQQQLLQSQLLLPLLSKLRVHCQLVRRLAVLALFCSSF